MIKLKTNNSNSRIIVLNKHTQYEFTILKEFEAGLSLQGWEVKSLRTNKVSIRDSYVSIKDNEVFLLESNFSPLPFISMHNDYDVKRARKLLLNQCELKLLYNYIKLERYTVVALSLYWKGAWCKAKIGIAKGKKQYDKRAELKERTWKLNKIRIMKNMRH